MDIFIQKRKYHESRAVEKQQSLHGFGREQSSVRILPVFVKCHWSAHLYCPRRRDMKHGLNLLWKEKQFIIRFMQVITRRDMKMEQSRGKRQSFAVLCVRPGWYPVNMRMMKPMRAEWALN